MSGETVLHELLNAAIEGPEPLFSGAVALVAEDGATIFDAAVGLTKNYALASGDHVRGAPVGMDTLFDLASITKIFVTATVLAELEAQGLSDGGLESLKLPLAKVLPEFSGPGMDSVTVLDLLTHQSGLPGQWADNRPGPDAWARFRNTRPIRERGTEHEYSCVGFIWLGAYLESRTGAGLDELLARHVVDPMGLSSTGYRPQSPLTNIAATEVQGPRGLVHGEVHDETAYALGGLTANAGLFSSGKDLLAFTEMLRNHGVHQGQRILSAETVALMAAPAGGPDSENFRQGVGLRLGEPWLDAMRPRPAVTADVHARGHLGERSPESAPAAGHAGFTGTAMAFTPHGSRSVVLLSNRVHPGRNNDAAFAQFRLRFMQATARL